MSSKRSDTKDNHALRIKSLEARLKVLAEDRKNFLKICKVFGLVDSELVFESADLNGSPVDLDDLVTNHVGTLQRNQRISQFLLDVLAEIYKPDVAPQIDEVLRSDPMGNIRSRLCERQTDVSLERPVVSYNSIAVGTTFSDIDKTVQTEPLPPSLDGSLEETRLRSQIDSLQNEYSELQETLTKKDEEIFALNEQIKQLQDRSCQVGLFEDLALRQAARDAEVAMLKEQLASMERKESDQDFDDASIFRKNIFIKVLTYSLTGEYVNLGHMVPIIRTVFELDDDEAGELSKLCESLNNQSMLSSILWR